MWRGRRVARELALARVAYLASAFFSLSAHGAMGMGVSPPPPSLEVLLEARGRAAGAAVDPAGTLRRDALREDGLAVGAQAGLARRWYEIQHTLRERSSELDRAVDFGALLMDHNVLPPVLVQASDVVEMAPETSDTITVVDQTYEIVTQARFVTVPPTWRDYLVSDAFTAPSADVLLRPTTDAEATIWRQAMAEGWTAGVAQAQSMLDEGLRRMRRDYDGMVLYRKLLARQMVSRPYVSQANFGVTGDADHVRINERVLRITAAPALRPTMDWRPIVVPASPMPSPDASEGVAQ